MVKKKKIGETTLFLCEICGLGYLDKETARKCEEWCKRTGTCSIEITKKAVYFPGLNKSSYQRVAIKFSEEGRSCVKC